MCLFTELLFREDPSSAESGSGKVKSAFPFGVRPVKKSSLLRLAPLKAFELSDFGSEIQVVSREICSRPETAGAFFIFLKKG